jgi:integrase
MRFATIPEVRKPAEGVPGRYRARILVAAFGGLRWGELAGLRRWRIDMEACSVVVIEQLTEIDAQLERGPVKSRAGARTVVLPKAAADALARHLDALDDTDPDGLVFTAPEGGPLRHSNFTHRVWYPTTKAAGVEGLRFHDLRHTAATLALAAGANTRELMQRIGHASPAAALRYQHVMDGRDALWLTPWTT